MTDQARSKIEESLKTCLANLLACQTLKELAVPTEIMIKQVTALIRPECDVEFSPLKKDPQEIENIEESKQYGEQDVIFWMNKLTAAIKKRTQERLSQIQKMLQHRADMIQSFDTMQTFNVHSSQLQKQTIAQFSKEIEDLQNEEGWVLAQKEKVSKKVCDKIKKAIELISKNPIKSKYATRYSDPYMPIVKLQDNEYPPNNAQSFDNYLIAVENNKGVQFNFIFKSSYKSDLKFDGHQEKIKINLKGKEVKRAVVWYNPKSGSLSQIKLFDKNDRQLLEAGVPPLVTRQLNNHQSHEVVLEDGERIIGYKSRKCSDSEAYHFDLQFLIGKLI